MAIQRNASFSENQAGHGWDKVRTNGKTKQHAQHVDISQ
jgi:hypothetical protein